MKIKLFTHTDLDGVGCAILFKSLLGEEFVDVSYCNYDKINEKVTNFVTGKTDKNINDYEYIFITDISVNEDVANGLNAIHEDVVGPFIQLLDHHGTAKWLNKYDWAHVEEELFGVPEHKSSGTSLVIDFFERQRPGFGVEITDSLRQFAEQVRRYDTWEWSTIYDDVAPKEMNDLLYMIGREDFVTSRLKSIKEDDGLTLTETECVLLSQKQKEIKAYIQKKNIQMIKEKSEHGLFGLVFAEQHTSELGNELCKLHPDIAFVAIIDMGERKVSFRTIRDDVHLGELAKELGGGGHPKAAGASFADEKVFSFLGDLF